MASTKTVTISGQEVSVTTPYEEGHQCSAAEAKALNQMRAENLGNNFRKKIKDAGEDQAKLSAVLAEFAKADSEYVFSLASAGGGRTTMSPIEREARSLAIALVNGAIKAKNQTIKAYKEANPGKYDELVATYSENPRVLAEAEKNVKAAQKSAKEIQVEGV